MPGQTVGGKSVKSVNPSCGGVRWQSESASGDTALAESDGRELRGCTFAKSQSGVATLFCRRTPMNAASPNVYKCRTKSNILWDRLMPQGWRFIHLLFL